MRTQQIIDIRDQWMNSGGDAWVQRNATEIDHEKTDIQRFGFPRRTINEEFLEPVSRDAHVLEVGAGFGLLLTGLKDIGFHRLLGIDINLTGLHLSKHPGIQANGAWLPFPDESFDMVCTNGTLMHIHPLQLRQVTDEILRVTRRWLWFYEPVAPRLHVLNFAPELNMPVAWLWDWPAMLEVLQPTIGLCKGRIWRSPTGTESAMMLYEKGVESEVWF